MNVMVPQKIINNVSGNQVYLNNELITAMELIHSEVEVAIQQFILGQPQIETVITRTQLLNKKFSEGLEETYTKWFSCGTQRRYPLYVETLRCSLCRNWLRPWQWLRT